VRNKFSFSNFAQRVIDFGALQIRQKCSLTKFSLKSKRLLRPKLSPSKVITTKYTLVLQFFLSHITIPVLLKNFISSMTLLKHLVFPKCVLSDE